MDHFNTRHPQNKNLTLHTDPYFRGLPVQIGHGPLITEYLERLFTAIHLAMNEHPRLFAVRFNLHYPASYERPYWHEGNHISRFIESLKGRLQTNRNRATRNNQRVHSTTFRYAWAKEQVSSQNPHYHVVLLLNRDAFHTTGNRKRTDGNLAAYIRQAWASAIGLDEIDARGLVHFCGEFRPKLELQPSQELQRLFYAASYLTKSYSKQYGGRDRSFHCSDSERPTIIG